MSGDASRVLVAENVFVDVFVARSGAEGIQALPDRCEALAPGRVGGGDVAAVVMAGGILIVGPRSRAFSLPFLDKAF